MEAIKYYLSNDLNEDVLSLIKDNSLITITDALGRVEYANDNYCNTIERRVNRVSGEAHELLKSHLHTGLVYKDLWRTLKMGHRWTGVLTETLESGKVIWLEATIIPIECDIDRQTKFLGLYKDVTNLYERNNALLEAKTKALDFIESLPFNVFSITKHGKILNVNKDFCDVKKADLIGTYLYDHIEMSIFEFFKKNIDAAFRSKVPNRFETSKYNSKGKNIFYSVIVAPVFNELGGVFSGTVTIQEIFKTINLEGNEEE
ncbi:PAS domain-containing protein [Olleya sp. HaHaR_3_96]|uniref:PAS domain-containing protein n=1 Tax=Olleya sp. HaHaR_3_96 TaxID=2745560 RepID=UPI001C4FBC0E|nr:PAS domain-containing protein [Olleya sp. HaHaR_3_96]QXP59358.1 PAS domain S-box protein [Olleya sp. HaHaR_3_96]